MKPFKTAYDLGITADEYEALLWVRRSLSDGTIPEERFDLGTTYQREARNCASVACIGGWMCMHMLRHACPKTRLHLLRKRPGGAIDHNVHEYVHEHPRLKRLFFLFDRNHQYNYPDVTAAHAVRAIDNLLTTGDPDWNGVMAV